MEILVFVLLLSIFNYGVRRTLRLTGSLFKEIGEVLDEVIYRICLCFLCVYIAIEKLTPFAFLTIIIMTS